MTRINVVPVQCLTNKHLLAEYKEITRVFTAVKKLVEKGYRPEDVDAPTQYTLGAGHVKFFYNKIHYILSRYSLIYGELVDRGFNIDQEKFSKIFRAYFYNRDQIPDCWYGEYKPTREDMYLNMARLVKRCKIEKVLEELKSGV